MAMNSLEPIKRLARLAGIFNEPIAGEAALAAPPTLAARARRGPAAVAEAALDAADAAVADVLARHGGAVAAPAAGASRPRRSRDGDARHVRVAVARGRRESDDRRTPALYELARVATLRAAARIRRIAPQLHAPDDVPLLAIADVLTADDAIYPFEAALRS